METNSIARRHHYLPQAYLAAFTSTGLKDGRFYVMDVGTGNAFSTSPNNVAVRRDFNRVDVDDYPPDVIENALAPFERETVDAIRRVMKLREFPGDDDLNLILNLLCLIAVRNPNLRQSFNRSREQVIRQISNILVSDRKIWDHHVKKAREDGVHISDAVSFENVKQFIDNDEYRIKFHPQGNLRIELKAFENLLPILGKRIWSLLIAPSDGPEFICSDHPVTLVWKGNRTGPVGFGLKKTEVYFPLGRHVGLYGVYEDPLNSVVICKPGNIATMNRRVVGNAEQHIYSAQKHFVIWNEGSIREIKCPV